MRPAPYIPGAWGTGPCSTRMCLTWLTYWRGAGAALHAVGVWPRARDGNRGAIFELGPPPSAQFPLLTDEQCIRLLNEGCPFSRPSERLARAELRDIDLDAANSPALGIPSTDEAGLHCRLAYSGPTPAPRWAASSRASAATSSS